MTCNQVHVIHGTGPLGTVRKRERGVACCLQFLAAIFEFIDGRRNFQSYFVEDGLVIVNAASGDSIERDGSKLSIDSSLCNCGIEEIRMIVVIVEIRKIIDKTGLVIFGKRTAAPGNVHIRALAGAHCNNELLLVVVVLQMVLLDCNLGIILHELLNSRFHC